MVAGRHEMVGSGHAEGAVTLALEDHGILTVHIVPNDVGINHVEAGIVEHAGFGKDIQVLIHQRIVDAMAVGKADTVIDDILLGDGVEDNLWSPGGLHVLGIVESECLEVLG